SQATSQSAQKRVILGVVHGRLQVARHHVDAGPGLPRLQAADVSVSCGGKDTVDDLLKLSLDARRTADLLEGADVPADLCHGSALHPLQVDREARRPAEGAVVPVADVALDLVLLAPVDDAVAGTDRHVWGSEHRQAD